jgi:WD40 repeat protein
VVEVEGGRVVARIAHDGTVAAVAFSPDGKLLATAGRDDNTARVVAVEDGREVARITYNAWVSAVAFSPDGKLLATASRDGTARLWSTNLDDMLRRFCAGPGRNLSRAEWRRHLGDLPWQATCEDWPTPPD